MFEQYKFQENLKNYAFYVDQNNAAGVIEPFGAYETCSGEDYYKTAAADKRVMVTRPYDYNGKKMVSYAVPILSNNEVQGVVMADINVSNFSKVESSNQKYPSMYATIYDNGCTIIYDSEDVGNVGKTMGDFMKNHGELSAVQSFMSQSQSFQVQTTRENGQKVVRYFTPIQAGS